MKKIIIIITSIFLLTSCKKEKQPNPDPGSSLKKISTVARESDGANKSAFTYDNQGRVIEFDFSNGHQRWVYNYSAQNFSATKYNASNVLSMELFNGSISNGHLASISFRFFNSSGVETSQSTSAFSYDAAGYLVKIQEANSWLGFEYSSGNCTKVTFYGPGGVAGEWGARRHGGT